MVCYHVLNFVLLVVPEHRLDILPNLAPQSASVFLIPSLLFHCLLISLHRGLLLPVDCSTILSASLLLKRVQFLWLWLADLDFLLKVVQIIESIDVPKYVRVE